MGSSKVKAEMLSSSKAILFLFVSYTTLSNSLTCYKCDQIDVANSTCNKTKQSEWCGDEEGDIQWCYKAYTNWEGVVWGCAQKKPPNDYEECKEESKDANTTQTECWCNSDLCNSAVSTQVTWTTFFLFIPLVFILTCFH